MYSQTLITFHSKNIRLVILDIFYKFNFLDVNQDMGILKWIVLLSYSYILTYLYCILKHI